MRADSRLDSNTLPVRVPAVRVLLVEDDETIAAGLTFFLEEEGFLVEWSPAGAGVAKKVAADPPNLLILDVQLGDSDGREIYRALRRAGHFIPVLLMSGTESIAAKDLDEDAAFLQKPFAMEEFLRVTAALLAFS